jgi:hypothetical protein
MKQKIILMTQEFLTKLALDIEYGGTPEGIEEENNLFEFLQKNMGYSLEDYPDDLHYCLRATDEERAMYILSVIIPQIEAQINDIEECKSSGHDWEHNLDIGPDSGSESAECKRCGKSFTHTYY